MHRDIKPENFLISTKSLKLPGSSAQQIMNLKLADFGLAREARGVKFTEYVSTRWYRAPELVIRQPQYTRAVDVFALGAMMTELFLGRPVFPGRSESEQLFSIVSVLGTKQFESWQEGHSLAKRNGLSFPAGH
jgi:protein kinase